MTSADTQPELTQGMESLHLSSSTLLTEFPTEVLLDIFSHCDYLTLTTGVSPVCRHFRTIIKESSATLTQGKLAEALFVDEFKKRTFDVKKGRLPPQILKIHPCFQYLQVRVKEASKVSSGCGGKGPYDFPAGDASNLGFIVVSGSRFQPIKESSMANENAFSPSCDTAALKFLYPTCKNCGDNHMDDASCGSTPGKPITVSDLAQWISDAMNGIGADTVFFEEHELSRPFAEIETGEKVRYYLGRCIFGKIDVKTVTAAGGDGKTLAPDVSFWHLQQPTHQPARVTYREDDDTEDDEWEDDEEGEDEEGEHDEGEESDEEDDDADADDWEDEDGLGEDGDGAGDDGNSEGITP